MKANSSQKKPPKANATAFFSVDSLVCRSNLLRVFGLGVDAANKSAIKRPTPNGGNQ